MTERERLIKLIINSVSGCARNWAETIADYLLANGVIVPPVKVGDKIYRKVGDGSIIAWDIVRMDIYVDEMGFVDDRDNWIGFDDIGKSVFLTREEAEKALKGDVVNDERIQEEIV